MFGLSKTLSKLYYSRSELIVKYNAGLKSLLHQGVSETVIYYDLVTIQDNYLEAFLSNDM